MTGLQHKKIFPATKKDKSLSEFLPVTNFSYTCPQVRGLYELSHDPSCKPRRRTAKTSRKLSTVALAGDCDEKMRAATIPSLGALSAPNHSRVIKWSTFAGSTHTLLLCIRHPAARFPPPPHPRQCQLGPSWACTVLTPPRRSFVAEG